MSTSEDFLWVSQVVLSGRRESFDCLVRKYQSQIRRFFLHQTFGNEPVSDDLAQETFIKAWMHIGSFKSMAKFSTWLFRIAYNVWYDYVSREAAHPSCGLDTVEIKSWSESADHDAKIDLYKALEILKPEERTAILLAFIEGMPHPQVAETMGCPLGTVKSHISRGKEKLSVYLQKSAYDLQRS